MCLSPWGPTNPGVLECGGELKATPLDGTARQDEEFERKSEEKKKLRAELEAHRAARTLPTGDPAKILEYLLQVCCRRRLGSG